MEDIYFFEEHLNGFIDVAADGLEQFALILIKPKNKINKIS